MTLENNHKPTLYHHFIRILYLCNALTSNQIDPIEHLSYDIEEIIWPEVAVVL